MFVPRLGVHPAARTPARAAGDASAVLGVGPVPA